MYFAELLNLWAAATPTSCCYCFTITSPQSIRLKPSRINQIVIPIEGRLATQFMLRVHSHLCDKPWRVISEYLFLDEIHNSITIPILTSCERLLRRNEPICHFTLILPHSCLQNLRGESLFYKHSFFYYHKKKYKKNIKKYIFQLETPCSILMVKKKKKKKTKKKAMVLSLKFTYKKPTSLPLWICN
jgi:hypothetical protein